MRLNHIHNYQSSMKRRLHSGITPAQFELDALRLDGILLQVQANAAFRKSRANQTKKQRAKSGMTLQIALSQFGQLIPPFKRSEV